MVAEVAEEEKDMEIYLANIQVSESDIKYQ